MSNFFAFKSRCITGYVCQSFSSCSIARPLKSSFFPQKYASSVERSRLFPKRRGRLRKYTLPSFTSLYMSAVLSTYTNPSLRRFSKFCRPIGYIITLFVVVLFIILFVPWGAVKRPRGGAVAPLVVSCFYPTAFISVKVKGETPSASLVPLYKEGQLSLPLEILDFSPFGRRPLVRFAQDDKA